MTATAARLPLVLLHGWGFDASVWEPLRTHLPGWTMQARDAGYFGRPAQAPLPAAYVAVGHSLGAMRCLALQDAGCRGWILINGFTRFCAAPDFPDGVPVRLVDRMLARLAGDPAAVVGDFRKRCGAGAPAADAGTDLAALTTDLLHLRDGDARAQWAGRRVPACVLAGEADPIVSPALTQASFDIEASWCPGGGHLLPWTHPAWCAQHVRAFAGRLAADAAAHRA